MKKRLRKSSYWLVFIIMILSLISVVEAQEEIALAVEDQSQEIVSGQEVSCSYRSHVENRGWLDWVKDGEDGGSTGQGLRMEAIEIKVETDLDVQVEYRTHVENRGWLDWVNQGEPSGTDGQGLRLEAIELRLSGSDAGAFDLYYQVHAENFAWLSWAKQNKLAGTQDLGLRLEGIRIQVLKKGTAPVGDFRRPFVDGRVKASYQTHVENQGWQAFKNDGDMSGTSGQGLRLEAIKIKLANQGYDLGLSYETQIENIGWQGFKQEGDLSGTEGQGFRLEAIRIKLRGQDQDLYDLYYQVHAEAYGWMDWAKNGENAGTDGMGLRLEGIRIKVIPKGMAPPGSQELPFLTNRINLVYRAHVQDRGWQDWKTKGELSGTTEEALRLEALEIKVENEGYDVGVTYQVHLQNRGWQDWKTDGQLAGTVGENLRIEAIRLKLTGKDAKICDLYYEACSQGFNWLPWVTSGESAGYTGKGLRLEGLKLLICPKGSPAPATTKQKLGSLTQLVNKNNSMPSNYVPADLVNVDLLSTRTTQLRAEAAKHLGDLFKGANDRGLNLYCLSGYRSYATQASIYQSHVDSYGLAAAELVSARPGMSEHQLGLAMDVTSVSAGFDLVESFADTAEGQFVKNNAHHYGFIIRYPKDKTHITGYAYEPWHLRYLGLEVAQTIYESGKTMEEFYGLY